MLMVKEKRRLVMPIVGEWYQFIAKRLPKVNHRAFCLCILLDETDPFGVFLYIREGDSFVMRTVDRTVIKEAIWVDTNRFHQFCLNKLQDLLKTGLTLKELQNNVAFNLYFDFATQFRVFRAKNEHFAIDRTYDVVNRMLSGSMTLEKKNLLLLAHKELLDGFFASLENHF